MVSKTKILDIRNLTVYYNHNGKKNTVLSNVSLNIQNNEIVSIIGDNGTGKSTLAYSIMGFDHLGFKVPNGEIFFKGHNILNEQRKHKFRGSNISYICQDPNSALNPVYTIGHQLSEMLRRNGKTKKSIEKIVTDYLSRLEFEKPEEILNYYPHQISEGMKQRVLIAQSLIQDPEILIADEPTSNLDVITKKEIISYLLHLKKIGIINSLFLITHDYDLVLRISDKVYEIKKKKCTSLNELIIPKVEYFKRKENSNARSSKKVLKLKNVSLIYNKNRIFGKNILKEIVSDVSFNVYLNRNLCIVGKSGAGKTSIARLIANISDVFSSNIFVKGEVNYKLNTTNKKVISESIHLIFQNPGLSFNPSMSVYRNYLIVYKNFNINFEFRKFNEKLESLLQFVGLGKEILKKKPNELSGGETQICAIMRALIQEPKIIIFDETMSMLDTNLRQKIIRLLHKVQNNFQIGYIFVTHDLRGIFQLIDDVIVLDKGRIIESGTIYEIVTNPQKKVTKGIIKTLSDVSGIKH